MPTLGRKSLARKGALIARTAKRKGGAVASCELSGRDGTESGTKDEDEEMTPEVPLDAASDGKHSPRHKDERTEPTG